MWRGLGDHPDVKWHRRHRRLLKHWEKFVLSDDVLYRVSRDQISKTRHHQFVVPDCLKAKVLKVHEVIKVSQGP